MTNNIKTLYYAHAFIVRRLLPLGVIVLLTGLFWAKDGSQYTKFYYGLIAAPALLVSLFRYKDIRAVAA